MRTCNANVTCKSETSNKRLSIISIPYRCEREVREKRHVSLKRECGGSEFSRSWTVLTVQEVRLHTIVLF